jgi:starch synthase (maltosyl-transferring)
MQEWDALTATDLVTGQRSEWRSRRQHVRIEPDTRPFAIWRIAPAAGLPRDDLPLARATRIGEAGHPGSSDHGASETHHEA